jgi:predicted Zn-dependent protease
VNTVGGVGLNAVFLKFSRDDEYEADATGAQIMALAGYDPNAMATFFEQLRALADPGAQQARHLSSVITRLPRTAKPGSARWPVPWARCRLGW